VTLPPEEYAAAWDVVIDTGGSADVETHVAGSTVPLQTRSLMVLREHAEPEADPDHSVAASLAALSSDTGQVGVTPAADQRHRRDGDG
jgi:glycogen operon protein